MHIKITQYLSWLSHSVNLDSIGITIFLDNKLMLCDTVNFLYISGRYFHVSESGRKTDAQNVVQTPYIYI